MMRRDRSGATPHVQASLALARQHGFADFIASGPFDEGWLRAGTLDREAGIAEMRQGLVLLRSRQDQLFSPLRMTLLAEAEAEAGRPRDALVILDTELANIERTGQRWYLAGVRRARGEVLLKCQPRDATAAESEFASAIDIARGQAAKLFELQAVVSLSRLWRDQGKRVEARDLLSPIYHWFTEGFDAPDLKDAKALLDELA